MKKAVTLEVWVDDTISNSKECVEEVIQEAMSHYYCSDGTIDIKIVENTYEGLMKSVPLNIDFNKVKEEYVFQLKRQKLINKINKIKKENNKKELAYKLAIAIEDEIYKINNSEDLSRFINKYRCTKYEIILNTRGL